MAFAGIDPGLGGALALVTDEGLEILDMPVETDARGKRAIDARALLRVLTGWRERGLDLVLIEQQQAMPKQGVASSFACGVSFGVLRCALVASAAPFEAVRPGAWKKAMGLDAAKGNARALALQLFPSAESMLGRRKDEGRSEALLLAEFARRRRGGAG